MGPQLVFAVENHRVLSISESIIKNLPSFALALHVAFFSKIIWIGNYAYAIALLTSNSNNDAMNTSLIIAYISAKDDCMNGRAEYERWL